jgi:RNA polymerase sigma-70 factor (ECF subfamily)
VRRQLRDARKNICETIESSSDSGEYLLDELGREQELSALRRAILNLPVKYREIIVLCDLEGMEYERAAEQLGCAVGTVRSRLHRARKILQMKLRRLERCPA